MQREQEFISEWPKEYIENAIAHGVHLYQSGATADALEEFLALEKRGIVSARLYCNIGALLDALDMKEEAILYLERSAIADPSYTPAFRNLATAINDSPALVEKTAKKLANIPNLTAHSLLILAEILNAAGRVDEATGILNRAALIDQNDPDPYIRLAEIHLEQGNPETSLEYALFALSLNPQATTTYSLLSDIFSHLNEQESAMAAIEQGLSAKPDDEILILKKAKHLQSSGQISSALGLYTALESSSIKKEAGIYKANCFREIGYQDKAEVIYSQIEAHEQINPAELIPLIFASSIRGEDGYEDLKRRSTLYSHLSRQYLKGGFETYNSTPSPLNTAPVNTKASRSKRIRIGILTGDLGGHCVSTFLASFLFFYDKSNYWIELISTHWRHDYFSKALAEKVDHCFSVYGMHPAKARSTILERNFDIIIETSGFTAHTGIGLISERCAPIQCHWIGYHASTHQESIDYFITDSVVAEERVAKHMSEETALLDRCWIAQTPYTSIPEAYRIDDNPTIRFGAFCQGGKITDQTLGLWSEVLKEVPNSNLTVKGKYVDDKALTNRILGYFKNQGIELDRIAIAAPNSDWLEHMSLYNHVDISLDTTPWSSATTAFDAMAMGAILIAAQGNTISSRMSSSVVYHRGNPEWIASTNPKEYAKVTAALAEDIGSIRKNRRAFQSESLRSQLFDQKDLAHKLELLIERIIGSEANRH